MIRMMEIGYIHRMKIYLAEMFPLHLRIPYSIGLYLAVAMFVAKVHVKSVDLLSQSTFIGSWSVLALLLILRLMDELKDLEIDRELFQERPVPSGRVKESDIWISLLIVIGLFLGANVFAAASFIPSVIVLAYAVLMFRYFFIPNILRKFLLLNLASHNPIVPLMLVYLVLIFAADKQIAIKFIDWCNIGLFVLMMWSAFLSWELARKIRSKDEETEYVTYSQIFGYRVSVIITFIVQSIGASIALYLAFEIHLSWVFLMIVGIGYMVVLFGHIRFLVRPSPETSKLKPFAEIYAITLMLASIVECGVIS